MALGCHVGWTSVRFEPESSWNCSRGPVRDSVDLGDDRGTLQGQMCTEKDPQCSVYSAREKVAVPRHSSFLLPRVGKLVYRALAKCVPCQPQVSGS